MSAQLPDPLHRRDQQEAAEERGEHRPSRKIRLDTRVYCPTPADQREGDPDCDHDFSSTPSQVATEWVRYDCTRCKRKFYFDVWD